MGLGKSVVYGRGCGVSKKYECGLYGRILYGRRGTGDVVCTCGLYGYGLPLEERAENAKKLEEWIKENGGHVDGATVVTDDYGGLGLVATRHIEKDKIVLRAPRSIIMRASEILREDEWKVVNKFQQEDISLSPAVALLVECMRGETSPWFPYLSSLPSLSSFHQVYMWSEEEIAELYDPSFFHIVKNWHDKVEEILLSLQNMAGDEGASWRDKVTLDNLKWAILFVESHCVEITKKDSVGGTNLDCVEYNVGKTKDDEVEIIKKEEVERTKKEEVERLTGDEVEISKKDDVGLVPLLELVNGSHEGNCRWDETEDETKEIVALKFIEKGEYLTTKYSMDDKLSLLLLGMSPLDSPPGSIFFPLSVRKLKKRWKIDIVSKEFENESNIMVYIQKPGPDFYSYLDPHFLGFCRLMVFENKKEFEGGDWNSLIEKEPWSEENESKMFLFMVKELELARKKYKFPASYEEMMRDKNLFEDQKTDYRIRLAIQYRGLVEGLNFLSIIDDMISSIISLIENTCSKYE